MESRRPTYVFFLILLALASPITAWSIIKFPFELGAAAAIFGVAGLALSGAFRLQLPKSKVKLSAGDTFVFLAFLLFGPQAAVLFAVAEAAVSALAQGRGGAGPKNLKIAINMCIAAVSAFAMTATVVAVRGHAAPGPAALAAEYLALIALMGVTYFSAHTIFGLVYFRVCTGLPPLKINKQVFLNSFVVTMAAAFAGTVIWIGTQNPIYLAAAGGIGALVWGGRRLFAGKAASRRRPSAPGKNATKKTEAVPDQERIRELENYIAELEKRGRAMRETTEELRHAAYNDPLTGLPNRKSIAALISEMIGRDAGERSEFAVLHIDINRFKTLNESLGRSAGDRVIVCVAERLANLKGHGHTVGRIGGDEFGVLIPRFKSRGDVKRHAEKIARSMAQPIQLGNRQLFTGISIGLAFGPTGYANADEVLRDADIAMHQAKDKDTTLEMFDPGMHAMAVNKLELETDLRSAIERKEFEVYYQPIVNLQRARLEGFEALVRWNHPSKGLVSPADFIPIAESTGLIIPITKQILTAACRQMVAWQQDHAGMDHATISVNLSGAHFAQPNLVRQVAEVIDATGIPPGSLRLEITESSVMTNAERAIETLKGLRESGVRISIDDFGTGYSSLSYLQRFPIDTLKVDQSFVSTMEAGSENGEIVRTVIALAKVLGLSVVAEGIESIHQVHQLQILGCDYGQGYLFGRPLTAGDARRMVEDPNMWANILPISGYQAIPPELEYSDMRLAN